MMQAFILINVESSSEDKVLKELRKMDFVRESYVSYGIYDLISKIESDTMEHIKENVSKIRTLDNVRSTLTLVMM